VAGAFVGGGACAETDPAARITAAAIAKNVLHTSMAVQPSIAGDTTFNRIVRVRRQNGERKVFTTLYSADGEERRRGVFPVSVVRDKTRLRVNALKGQISCSSLKPRGRAFRRSASAP
jgi:hypothetical protein